MRQPRALRRAAHIGHQFNSVVLQQCGEILEFQNRVTDRKKRPQSTRNGWETVHIPHADSSFNMVEAYHKGCRGASLLRCQQARREAQAMVPRREYWPTGVGRTSGRVQRGPKAPEEISWYDHTVTYECAIHAKAGPNTLAFVHYYFKIHGHAPAEADMQRYFRVSPPSVHQMILTLEKRGLIARTPGQARSIRVLIPREHLPDLE